MIITKTIKALQDKDHYGIGEYIEIAKGKNEYVTEWKDFKTKIRRLWRLKRT